ncbi:uncharacterized protein LAJ45_04921 [Morchella importuna]|uniref:uncharacterized protein n=1 Tax=Morchella importuna TaxID=1174673 RepID=UPI001E8E74AC|nr:uncharacterized protein LAJ45_04921 [Morchella importuna]KAH8151219.1 hypothetical protein LAJ45_04921 [Morchella importuna]
MVWGGISRCRNEVSVLATGWLNKSINFSSFLPFSPSHQHLTCPLCTTFDSCYRRRIFSFLFCLIDCT